MMFLTIACVVGGIMIAILAIGLVAIMIATRQDGVSNAREGWLTNRSEKGDQGW